MLENVKEASDAAATTAKTFIRVTEVWVPDEADGRLKRAGGLYGDLTEFEAVSGKEIFALGEGLPGKAWAEQKPIVLKGFRGSYFKRTDAAEAAGLTAGIAMPVFAGSRLTAVVTFLFGDDSEHVGAVEVWAPGEDPSGPLALQDGYFGTADHFAWISRHTRFPKGMGLPGKTWESGRPKLFHDLGISHRFLRSDSAADAGMTAGLGLPVSAPSGDTHIVTLLSALGTPIARQFEIWSLTGDGYFTVSDGVPDRLPPSARVTPGEGILGTVAATGVPVATGEPGSAIVAIPIHRNGKVTDIAAWYF
ncbi:GAF domain-containing protein [Algicella marina]|uniref:GAF domain-containing protein n=1 Tax=Algicella marina TaxID=2683284 RepID=A0A6P1T6H3_9RHOB|nr:GAF domain-containing protein [Algicella marina]QHQ36859.1 GAF domain-containing protein [Algicella marina]